MSGLFKKIEYEAKNVIEKGKEFTEVLQLEREISVLEKQIEQYVNKIGRYVYENNLLKDEEQIQTHREQIGSLYISIEGKKKEIRNVKNIIYCPECNVELPASAKFCRECGAVITVVDVEVVTRICPECHAAIKEDDKFCANCGKQLE